jgi:hypothetical protein
METFTIRGETSHRIGDHACPMCPENYPEPCGCGALMHAEAGAEQDIEGNDVLDTRCERCGRAEDDLDQW